MAVQFSVPKSPKKSIDTIDVFLGADFTNSPANVDIRRSPNLKNMVRAVPGKVRKSMGWSTVYTFGQDTSAVNGFHTIIGAEDEDYATLYHVGTKIYYYDSTAKVMKELETTVPYGETPEHAVMNNARSHSWQMNDNLYIIDGLSYQAFSIDETPVDIPRPVSEIASAYIPTVTISKDPNGGGTPYEDLNLLQPGFIEQFLGTAAATEYQLSFTGLDNKAVVVKVLQSDGTWNTLRENTDFTVNRETGTITFGTAPGESPVEGEDNIKITAYRTVSGYADRINKCRFGILYGMNGDKNRLFLSGNPEYPNVDWHSANKDLTYFPDTSYATVGDIHSAIVGYSIISDKLVTHKDGKERDESIVIREGKLDSDKNEIFVIVNTLQGVGTIASDSFGYLESEPLFLTSQGIYAITPQDVTGERYQQNRSFYLNGKLLKESHLEKAYACVYNDNYILCVNGVCYILDGLQATQTDRGDPYSTRQYAGFYRTNVPANIMWVNGGELWFGTTNGKICKFATDVDAPDSYADDENTAIECIWETPDIDGNLFYKNKTLRYLAVRIEAAIASSIKIYAKEREKWSLIKYDATFARYFSFSQLTFSKLTFSTDRSQRICRTKTRIKKVDKYRLRFVNDALDEPFTLYNIAMEYIENGYFKG